ncbi:IS630 family transposase [Streptomyces sp. NPDC048527]|uniref:IS630 family transposase n=1 Tax=Streptomyces sp. NPDC048527 TaxID=3365568 RepID=UPI003713E05A
MPDPKPLSLELSDHERRVLRDWLRKQTASQALVLRSRIVLVCAEGRPNAQVAQDLSVWRETVRKWRSRFAADRLEDLVDRPRSGAPRKIRDEDVEALVARTLDQAPSTGDSHWSTRSMARSAGMSQSAVSRIWRAFGLKPHIVETWRLSTDPQFVTKVRDVVGVYLTPPENALVLAVDETSQIQALDRTQPVLPMTPTTPAKMTHDYVRHGTTTLFERSPCDGPRDSHPSRRETCWPNCTEASRASLVSSMAISGAVASRILRPDHRCQTAAIAPFAPRPTSHSTLPQGFRDR